MDANLLARLRKVASVVLAAAGAALASSCAPVPASTPPVAAVPSVQGPALWRVADKDTTIYLFGTVHALPKDVPWMRGAIGPALASADTLVTEIDLEGADPAAMQKAVLSKAILPLGQSLRDLLDAAQKSRFEAAMTRAGLPVNAIDRFEPWYATLMLTVVPLAKEGIVGENGVEKALSTKATSVQKREALETVEYQLSVFDELPQDAQLEYLMQVVDGSVDIRAQLERMMAEWLAGDADGLAALINEDLDADGALLERLLYQRNRAWADWVARRLDQPGTVFMAVGAGHLAGPKSVQADLATRGIRAIRVQ